MQKIPEKANNCVASFLRHMFLQNHVTTPKKEVRKRSMYHGVDKLTTVYCISEKKKAHQNSRNHLNRPKYVLSIYLFIWNGWFILPLDVILIEPLQV